MVTAGGGNSLRLNLLVELIFRPGKENDMARRLTIKSYRKTVVGAGAAPLFTAVEAAAGHKPSGIDIYVTCLNTNVGNVYVGDSNVTTDFEPLTPGGGMGWVALPMNSTEWIHLGFSDIYFLGTVGDTIIVTYTAFVD